MLSNKLRSLHTTWTKLVSKLCATPLPSLPLPSSNMYLMFKFSRRIMPRPTKLNWKISRNPKTGELKPLKKKKKVSKRKLKSFKKKKTQRIGMIKPLRVMPPKLVLSSSFSPSSFLQKTNTKLSTLKVLKPTELSTLFSRMQLETTNLTRLISLLRLNSTHAFVT